MKTMPGILLALSVALLLTFKLVLDRTYSFDALTCDEWVSCADLWMTCQGAYLCQDEACAVMRCFHATDNGPRHGTGFVWVAGGVLTMLYALVLARRSDC